jgi:protein-arginine kinase activator protein McsA
VHSRESTLARLDAEKLLAIEEDRFEDAASLRDQIKKLRDVPTLSKVVLN